jgi:hypothetical protein
MMEISADDLRPKDKEQVEAYFEQLDDEQVQRKDKKKPYIVRRQVQSVTNQFATMMEISADDLLPKDKEQVEAYFEQLDDEQVQRKDSPRKLIRRSLGGASKRFEAAKKKRKEDRAQRNRQYREVRRLAGENKRIDASIKLANTRNENLKNEVRRQKIEFHRQKQELVDQLRQLKFV